MDDMKEFISRDHISEIPRQKAHRSSKVSGISSLVMPTILLVSISFGLFLFLSTSFLLSAEASQYTSTVISNNDCQVIVSIAQLGTTRYIGCASVSNSETNPSGDPPTGVIWIQPIGQAARIWRTVSNCRPRIVTDEGTGYVWAGCDSLLYTFPPNTTLNGSSLQHPYIQPAPVDFKNKWTCSWAVLVAANGNSQSAMSRNARANNSYLDRDGPTIALGCIASNMYSHNSYFYISKFNQSTPSVTRVEGPQSCAYSGYNADTDGSNIFLSCGPSPTAVLQGSTSYSINISTDICPNAVWITYDVARDRIFVACSDGPVTVIGLNHPVTNSSGMADVVMTAKQCTGPTTFAFDVVTQVFYAACSGSGLVSFRADYTPAVIPVVSLADCSQSIFFVAPVKSVGGEVAVGCSSGIKQFKDGYFSEGMTNAACSFPSDMYADVNTGDVYQSCSIALTGGSLARIRGKTYQALTDPVTSCTSSAVYEDMSTGTIIISCSYDDIRAWQQNLGQAPDDASVLLPMSACSLLQQILPVANSTIVYAVCPNDGIYIADFVALSYQMVLPNNICSTPSMVESTPAGKFNSTLYIICRDVVGGGVFAVNHFDPSLTVQPGSGNADYNLTLLVPTSRCIPRLFVYDGQDSLIVGCGTSELIAYNIRTGSVNVLIDAAGSQCTGGSNVKLFDGYVYMLCDEFRGVKTIRVGDYMQPTVNLIDSECSNPTALAMNQRTGTIYTACTGFSATASGRAFQCYEGSQWVFGTCVPCPSGTSRNYSTILRKVVNCELCDTGAVSPTTGAQACTVCPPGKYQVSPYIECQDCQIGSYSDGYGSVGCTFCPEGTFGNTTGLSTSDCSGTCAAGYWCGLGATSPQSLPCGSRSVYCPAGSGRPIPVSAGYYSTNPDVPGTANTMTQQSACDVGQYCDGSGFARPCAPGRFANQSTTESCDLCDIGRWSDDSRRNSSGDIVLDSNGQPVLGAVQCELCAPGSFTARTGTITCSLCAPGSSQQHSGTTACQDCVAGRSAPESGHSICDICSAGRSASEPKSVGCSLCSPGRYSSRNESESCVPCDVGYFSVDFGAVKCDPCDPGRYNLQSGDNTCQFCSPGSASNATALNHTCPACSPGTSQFATGQISCDPCPPKKYSSVPGSLQCATCSTVTNVERTSCSESPCEENEEFDSDAGTCNKCGIGFTASKGGVCTTCPPATYTPGIGTGCIDCGQSGMTGLSCGNGRISVVDGYYAFQQPMVVNGRSYMVFQAAKCPENFCSYSLLQNEYFTNSTILTASTSTSAATQCIFPRVASALCGECAEGYVMQGGSCVECPKSNPGLLSLYFIISFAAVLFLLRSSQSGDSAGYSVILLYFAQTAMLEVGPVKGFIAWIRIVNFNAASGTGGSTCLAPLTAYEQYMVSIAMPIILLIELCFIALIHRALGATRFGKALEEEDSSLGLFQRTMHSICSGFAWSKYIGGVFQILLFSYTQTAASCIKFLTCVTVGDAHVVFFDPSIHCDSDEYKRYRIPILLALCLYVILFPIGVLLFLFIHRHKLADREVLSSENHITGVHLVKGTQGISASITPSFAAGPEAISTKGNDANRQSKKMNEPRLTSDQMTIEFLQSFGPLFRAFAPYAWYYQVAVLVRRTFFVICNVVLVSQPQTMGMVYTLLNFVSILMQLRIRPFQEEKLNTLEVLSLAILVVISSIITAYTSPYTTATQIVLFLLILLPLIFFFSLFVKQHALVLRQKLQRKGSMQLNDRPIKKQQPVDTTTEQQRLAVPEPYMNESSPSRREGINSTIVDLNHHSHRNSNRPAVIPEEVMVEMTTLPASPTQAHRKDDASLAPDTTSSSTSMPSPPSSSVPAIASASPASPPHSPSASNYLDTAARLRVAIRMLHSAPQPAVRVTTSPVLIAIDETARED